MKHIKHEHQIQIISFVNLDKAMAPLFANSKMTVFVIKRPYSRAFYTVGGADSYGSTVNRSTLLPRILCFEKKDDARFFCRFLNDMQDKQTNNSPTIDPVPLESLKRRCRLNSLGLSVYSKDGVFDTILEEEPCLDDFTFHLENNLRWYSG